MTNDAVSRARDDLTAGRPEDARGRLVDLVEVSDDREALDLLGEAHYALGDLPAAAAVWFGTGRKGPEVQEATDAWRAEHRDDFAAMWRSLPASVREADEQIPRIAALQRKAIEADPSLDRVVYDPNPAPVNPGPEAADDVEASEPPSLEGVVVDEPDDFEEPAAADELPAMDDPDVVEVERVDELDDAVDSRAEREDRDDTDLRTAEGASAALRPAGDEPTLDKVVPAGPSERKGVDTAMVIALALAVFAVICAIVGLITIVRWVVPG
ncbi:hypothetical protein ACQP1U_02365 [Actinomycetota bacterium]